MLRFLLGVIIGMAVSVTQPDMAKFAFSRGQGELHKLIAPLCRERK